MAGNTAIVWSTPFCPSSASSRATDRSSRVPLVEPLPCPSRRSPARGRSATDRCTTGRDRSARPAGHRCTATRRTPATRDEGRVGASAGNRPGFRPVGDERPTVLHERLTHHTNRRHADVADEQRVGTISHGDAQGLDRRTTLPTARDEPQMVPRLAGSAIVRGRIVLADHRAGEVELFRKLVTRATEQLVETLDAAC